MNKLEIKAPAKINLSLDVIKRRADGYHEVKMIMQTVELSDNVLIEIIPEGIQIECDSRWVPSNEENIAYKAAKLLMDTCKINNGVKISIEKRIPVAAGMAGGSTDAAAVFKGMNALFSLGLNTEELMVLGKQLGADVPYCIKGGTVLAEGIGEILTELHPFSGVDIVLVKPKIGVPTAWVYKNLDLKKISERPETNELIEFIRQDDKRSLAQNMKNVLETVTANRHQVIEEIKYKLLELGALGSMMSGSGPTVFGIFEDRQSAEYAYNTIKGNRWECFLTRTVSEEK